MSYSYLLYDILGFKNFNLFGGYMPHYGRYQEGLKNTIDATWGKESNDPVDRPKHYTNHPSGIECIQITEHMDFCIGNAIKYLWRAGLKDSAGDIEDLKKAIWYINRKLERLQNAKITKETT